MVEILNLSQRYCNGNKDAPNDGIDPLEWLIGAFAGSGYKIFANFHFFVNWRSEAVSGPLLLTKIATDRLESSDDGRNALLNGVNADQRLRLDLLNLAKISRAINRSAHLIVLPEVAPTPPLNEIKVGVVSVNTEDALKARISNLDKLMGAIKRHSGGSVRLGRKKLSISTSCIECYLSGTDAAYPGDIDAAIYDDEGRIVRIFEFKKHTLHGSKMDENLAEKYVANGRDYRKYKRISIFSNSLLMGDRAAVPTTILYYNTTRPEILLEDFLVVGDRFESKRRTETIRIDDNYVGAKDKIREFVSS